MPDTRGIAVYGNTAKSSRCFTVCIFFVLCFLSATAQAQEIEKTWTLDADLSIHRLTDSVYVITHSYPWPANSLYVVCGPEEALLVDTPYTPEATEKALSWLEAHLGDRKMTAINTGFHFDNLGGNACLKSRGIPIWGSETTCELIRRYGERSRRLFLSWLSDRKASAYYATYRSLAYVNPDHLFPISDGKILEAGGLRVEVFFPGTTHAPDNVAVHIPALGLLFGGCMLLAGPSVGNTQDADMSSWLPSVEKLKERNARLVVPGHGLRFDRGVIEHTIRILRAGP